MWGSCASTRRPNRHPYMGGRVARRALVELFPSARCDFEGSGSARHGVDRALASPAPSASTAPPHLPQGARRGKREGHVALARRPTPAKINLTDAEVEKNLTWRGWPPRRNRDPAMLGCSDSAPCYPIACQHWGPRFFVRLILTGVVRLQSVLPSGRRAHAFGGTSHRGLARLPFPPCPAKTAPARRDARARSPP